MTKLNAIAKQAISAKFAAAIQKEEISKSEAGRLLGLARPAEYPGMVIKNPEKASVGNKTWETLREWSNSGLSLKQYGAKHTMKPKKTEAKPQKEGPDKAKDGPELVSSKEDQAAEELEQKTRRINSIWNYDGLSTEKFAKYLEVAIRTCGIHININDAITILALFELISEKEGEVTLEDIFKIKEKNQ